MQKQLLILVTFLVLGTAIWYLLDLQSQSNVNEVVKVDSDTMVVLDCKEDHLKTMAFDLLDFINIDNKYWKLTRSDYSEEAEMFGWTDDQKIAPCSYRITYTGQKELDYKEGFGGDLDLVLKQNGWSADPFFSIDENVNGDFLVYLAHAGGPNGEATVYYKLDQLAKEVTFARVYVGRYYDNWAAYREGIADSMCPCSEEITLEVSAQVPFADIGEQ